MKEHWITDADRFFEALLVLTRAGLWERQPENFGAIPATAEDWDCVLQLARQQTVTGIAYRGLHYLPEPLMPPESLLVRWTAYADAVERTNRAMNNALASLTSMYRQCGLDPVIQKGQGVARFYASPLLRECGDIDIYFPSKQAWDTALAQLRQRGISVMKMADKSVSYRWQGVEVEHHRHLFDLHNPFLQGEAGSLEREHGFSSLTLETDPSVRISVPAPMLDLLLQNLHILKHTLGWGIGLRQLCDMARSCYVLHGRICQEKMEILCRKLGLSKWSPLLHSFLIEHLGLPEKCLPYPSVASSSDQLYEIIRRGGNFGHYVPGRKSGGQTWRHKMQTSHSFLRNIRFACRYAPKEAFWITAGLLRGQLH